MSKMSSLKESKELKVSKRFGGIRGNKPRERARVNCPQRSHQAFGPRR